MRIFILAMMFIALVGSAKAQSPEIVLIENMLEAGCPGARTLSHAGVLQDPCQGVYIEARTGTNRIMSGRISHVIRTEGTFPEIYLSHGKTVQRVSFLRIISVHYFNSEGRLVIVRRRPERIRRESPG